MPRFAEMVFRRREPTDISLRPDREIVLQESHPPGITGVWRERVRAPSPASRKYASAYRKSAISWVLEKANGIAEAAWFRRRFGHRRYISRRNFSVYFLQNKKRKERERERKNEKLGTIIRSLSRVPACQRGATTGHGGAHGLAIARTRGRLTRALHASRCRKGRNDRVGAYHGLCRRKTQKNTQCRNDACTIYKIHGHI